MAFPLLRLPLELREQIYAQYFRPADHLVTSADEQGGGWYQFDLRLLRVNKQVGGEALRIWRRDCVFVRVETPWPNAINHISAQGNVPIVATRKNDYHYFQHHTFMLEINAQFQQVRAQYEIVLLLEDVHKFAETWYYSSLAYTELNQQIGASFQVRHALDRAGQLPDVSHALQLNFLGTFGKIKGLQDVKIVGFCPSVETSVREEMATPHKSVQQCLEDALAIMDEGDLLVSTEKPLEALDAYTRAFYAIHIQVEGRMRKVHADNFFHELISAGSFRGQMAMTARVVLRLRLVSRVILSYMLLEQWAEAVFWGMRSIGLMRDRIDSEFDNFVADFFRHSDAVFIYARTAIALARMQHCEGDEEELREYREEELPGTAELWMLVGKYMTGPAKDAHRLQVVKEARQAGVNVPESISGGAESETETLRHMHLGELGKEPVLTLGMEVDEQASAS